MLQICYFPLEYFNNHWNSIDFQGGLLKRKYLNALWFIHGYISREHVFLLKIYFSHYACKDL